MGVEYDNTAFYYFAIAIISIFLVPNTISVVWRVLSKVLGIKKSAPLKVTTSTWTSVTHHNYPRCTNECVIVANIHYMAICKYM